jgi:NAD(P)-dependent dehydrogenase (short-subunit alcohol dehydrogenase family)
VEPARAGKYRRPVDAAGCDSADRRLRAIVQHAARSRSGAELGEVETRPVVRGPLDVHVHALFAGVIGDHVAERVFGEAGHPARRDAEPRGGNGDVELAAADVGVEAAGLLEPLGIRRSEPHHGFAEGDEIHAQSYARPNSLTRFYRIMSFPGLDLTGRIAVVIGATSGIGKAIALGLADAGADVVPTGRRAQLVKEAAGEVEARGRRSLAIAADVSDTESIQTLADAVIEKFGKVDILVNAAGRTVRRPTVDVSDAEWNEIMDTNLTGMLRACRVFGRHMIERRYGRIINIGSLTSVVALYEVAAYGASKAGVAALTKSLAVEWAPHGVCVNAILPGVFRTALNEGLLDGTDRGRELLARTPARRFGQPEEVAGAAVFLASDSASFVTGHLLAVDGGFLASGVNQ